MDFKICNLNRGTSTLHPRGSKSKFFPPAQLTPEPGFIEQMKSLKRYWRQFFVFVIIALVIVIVHHKSTRTGLLKVASSRYYPYHVWPAYINSAPATFQWYNERCFSNNIDLRIQSIENNMRLASQASYFYCRVFVNNVEDIYEFSLRNGLLELPKPFHRKVSKWLGNKKDLMEEIKNQEIIHIKNKYTMEYTAYNPLRAKRPHSKPKVEPADYVKQIVEESKPNCDFCSFKTLTGKDNLGRIVTNLTATASNSFKYDSYHQLIFPIRTHNPLDLSKNEIVDLFMTAKKWVDKVHREDSGYKYPMIIWDTFPHGGASQIHPHLQVSVDKYGYYGNFEALRKAADRYTTAHDGLNNYFTDLKDLHNALGLAYEYGSATVIAHMNAHKDYEVMLFSETVNKDIFELLYYVKKAFNEDLGQLCHSFGAIFPSLDQDDQRATMPVVLRMVSRGTVSSMNSDLGSLELFVLYNVNSSPYAVIDAIRKSVEKRSK